MRLEYTGSTFNPSDLYRLALSIDGMYPPFFFGFALLRCSFGMATYLCDETYVYDVVIYKATSVHVVCYRGVSFVLGIGNVFFPSYAELAFRFADVFHIAFFFAK